MKQIQVNGIKSDRYHNHVYITGLDRIEKELGRKLTSEDILEITDIKPREKSKAGRKSSKIVNEEDKIRKRQYFKANYNRKVGGLKSVVKNYYN